tara:strand:+ start:37988 stop:38437 length:450 start_codon:yes stop_codon:yes gene_type:complete
MVKRVIYPPAWLLIGLVAVFALNEYYPGMRFTGLASQLIGGAIIVFALFLLVSANGLFFRAQTGIIPFRPVTALVTDGVYRLSRNPMYLGMMLVLLGCAITVGAATALLVPLMFAVIIQFRYILPEEAMLMDAFPEDFAAYRARVRRWI